MMGELFVQQEMPEPPKVSFFKGLFGGGSQSLDREELCKIYITITVWAKNLFYLICCSW
jgi:hypothetical protein